jgi:hypothetical protein
LGGRGEQEKLKGKKPLPLKLPFSLSTPRAHKKNANCWLREIPIEKARSIMLVFFPLERGKKESDVSIY